MRLSEWAQSGSLSIFHGNVYQKIAVTEETLNSQVDRRLTQRMKSFYLDIPVLVQRLINKVVMMVEM